MGCSSKTKTVTATLHTNGTTTPVFIPMFTGRLNEIGTWRASFILDGGSSSITSGDYDDFEVQGAYRTADDDVSWSGKTVTGVGSLHSEAGEWQYGTSYVSAPTSAQLIQIGFNVANKSTDSIINKVTATLRLDLRGP